MTRFWKKFAAAALASALLLAPAAQAITPQQLKELLQEYYINDVPQAALEAETVPEIIRALGDPYTAYMDAEDFAAYQAIMSDETLVGIGVTGVASDEGILVAETYAGSPAEKAGVVPGDLILYVEGGPEIQDAQTVLALLRGEEGSEITFRVRRTDGREETITTRRAVITIPATSTTVLEDGTTAYISCGNFGESTQGYFVEGTENNDAVDMWIVDLRNNGGGDVYAATQSTGVFAGKGTVAFLRASGDVIYRYISDQDRTTLHPAILLVSPNTASAAELYALTIKDKNSGMLIGSHTYGKGVAQVVLTGNQFPDVLTEGDALRITAFQAYGVEGNTPQSIGVIPDLMVHPNDADDIALLFSTQAPADQDRVGWARFHLGGLPWYVDLSQAQGDTAPFFGEMLSAVPPGCRIFLGAAEGWRETTADEIARITGASGYQPRRFSDTAGTACQKAADTLYCYGMLSGMGDGTFQPGSGLTRAQLCALLVQAMGYPTDDASSRFSDVPEDSWFAPYVRAAQKAGYVQGMGDGTFAPNDPVTHEQVITVLGRLAAELNLTMRASSREVPADTGVPAAFSDWSRPWAWLLAMSQRSVLDKPLNMLYDDLTNIDPKVPATRGETAQILYNILYAVDVFTY